MSPEVRKQCIEIIKDIIRMNDQMRIMADNIETSTDLLTHFLKEDNRASGDK